MIFCLDFCPTRPGYTRKGGDKAYKYLNVNGKTHHEAASICVGDSATVPMFKQNGEHTAAMEVFKEAVGGTLSLLYVKLAL